jgi:DNA end-binding protein Ku
MWKGVIALGSTKVGVKLYSAVQDRDIHFKLLERKKHAPVEQRMVKPETDEAVPYEEVRKGFLSEGSYVMLEKEELAKLAPKPSRDIEITRFVTFDHLGPEWFVRPYYLGPDGDVESYFALQQALADAGREGIVHWVMRNTEYTGVLRAVGEHLMLITLRHQDEVVSTKDVRMPSGREHTAKEAQMAEQLIAAFEDEFDPTLYHNEHRERVIELVDAKAKGKRVRLKKVQEKKPEASLADALQRSLMSIHKKGESERKSAASSTPAKKKRASSRTRKGGQRKERAVA